MLLSLVLLYFYSGWGRSVSVWFGRKTHGFGRFLTSTKTSYRRLVITHTPAMHFVPHDQTCAPDAC